MKKIDYGIGAAFAGLGAGLAGFQFGYPELVAGVTLLGVGVLAVISAIREP